MTSLADKEVKASELTAVTWRRGGRGGGGAAAARRGTKRLCAASDGRTLFALAN